MADKIDNTMVQVPQFVYTKNPDSDTLKLRLVYTADDNQLKLRLLRKEKN